MWELYDMLLDGLPEGETVTSAAIYPIWTMVDSSCGGGLSLTPLQEFVPTGLGGSYAPKSLRDFAGLIKSWDFYEASMGLAAINSYYNQPERLPKGDPRLLCDGRERPGVFGGFDDLIRGKKVTMIGHGGSIDYLRTICDFTVLEKKCQPGDLPSEACEYLLPEQDFVFISASSLINKTTERMLELTKTCYTVLWGPSLPMTPRFFDFGVDALLGQIVASPAEVHRVAAEGGRYLEFKEDTKSVAWFKDSKMADYFRCR